MKNREQKTLRKLFELKAFIDKNPGAVQAEWYKATKLSRTMMAALVKHSIITKSGTKFFPNYTWAGPTPNIKMVYKLIDLQRAHFTKKFSLMWKESTIENQPSSLLCWLLIPPQATE